MAISTRVVGASFKPRQFAVSTRKVLSHSAAIGALAPEHFDDHANRPLRAFPTICHSFEYNLQAHGFTSPDPTGATLDELRRAVHATQDSFFHRPIFAGQLIHANGSIVEARRLTSGTLLIAKIVLTGDGNPDPLVTSWTGTIYRDVPLRGNDVCQQRPEPLPDVPAAYTDEYRIETTRTLPHIYSECAHIWNPIHTERHVAISIGLPDVILQGTATLNLALVAAMARHGVADSSAIARLCCEFRSFVIPGEDIQVTSGRTNDAIHFKASNNEGQPVLGNGYVALRP